MQDYLPIIHAAEEGGSWAEVPDLDGCFVQGEAVDELMADAPDAIDSHIAALEADGQPVPEAQPVMVTTVRGGASPTA
jgi:predicted RNase H-like HicB family nuclease